MKKKILLALAAAFVAIGASAQYRPSFIVSAGYQGANLITSDKDAGNKIKSGFRVGVAADFNVYNFGSGALSIQPGLYYSTKGAKYEGSFLGVKGTGTTNLGYIEIPVLANLSFGMSDGFGVFVNAGPYMGFGVNSSASSEVTSGDKEIVDSSSSKNLFKGDKGLKSFDAGIQVGAGVEYRRVQLGVGTQFGLVDMDRSDNFSLKNQTFFVTLGYRF